MHFLRGINSPNRPQESDVETFSPPPPPPALHLFSFCHSIPSLLLPACVASNPLLFCFATSSAFFVPYFCFSQKGRSFS